MSSGWQVVGYPDDPIPDDPGVVATQIAHLRSVAANIATQVAALPQSGQVDALVWKSQDNDAPAQFRKMASQLPHDLDLLRTRYVKVANALDDFLPALQQTQGQARANLTVALAAHQDMQAAQAGVSQMNDFNYQAQQAAANQNLHLKSGQTPAQPAPWTGPDYPAILTDATIRFNNAKGQIDSAVNQFNGASQTAANRVNAASNDGLKNQSSGWGWGSIGNFFKSVGVDTWHGIYDTAHSAVFQEIDPILIEVSDWAGNISAVAALVAMLPIPGVDVVADAISEAAGGVEALSDTVVIATDDNAKARRAAEEDLGWAALGLATAGAARVFGKGAELVRGVREASDALDAAKDAKVAAEADKLAKADEVVKAQKVANFEKGFSASHTTPASYGRLLDATNDLASKQKALSDATAKVGQAEKDLVTAQSKSTKALKDLKNFNGASKLKTSVILDLPSRLKEGVQALKAGEVSYPLINLAARDGSALGKAEFDKGLYRTVMATASGAIGVRGLLTSMAQAEQGSQ